MYYNEMMYHPCMNPYINYENYYAFRNNMKSVAYIRGGPLAPDIKGLVSFEDANGGTEVKVKISGLPLYHPSVNGNPPIGPHGFHIHKNGICEIGDPNDPFKSTGSHWNPDDQPHGNHAGDFPVLFSNDGYAEMTFFTNRFKPWEVIGKSIIIHQNPDDYRSQPAGNAGKRLACGLVEQIYFY